MSTLYSWKINSMKTRDEGSKKAVVSKVYWTRTATHEDGHTASIDGSSEVALGDSFTAYSELTEEQVIQWVRNCFTDEDFGHLKTKLDQEIAALTNPVTKLVKEPPLPWGTE